MLLSDTLDKPVSAKLLAAIEAGAGMSRLSYRLYRTFHAYFCIIPTLLYLDPVALSSR